MLISRNSAKNEGLNIDLINNNRLTMMANVKAVEILSAIGITAVFITALFGITQVAWATPVSNTVVARATVSSTCLISGANSFDFGTALGLPGNVVYPNTAYPTNVVYTVNDPGGNAPANILVAASGNWVGPTANIPFGNILWANTVDLTGTGLTLTLTNTLIPIAAPSLGTPTTSNNIYFGINVPIAQPPGLYTSNILLQNSCPPSNSVTLTVAVTANVATQCFISLSPSTINFGAINPGANVPTANEITDSDIGGNIAANVLVYGGNWIFGSNNFGVSNTLWSPSSLGTYSGNALTNSLVNTQIVVQAPTPTQTTTSNNIYFGLAIPAGTIAGTYSQNIVIENSC